MDDPWANRVNSHVALGALADLDEALEALPAPPDQQLEAQVARAKVVVEYILGTISAIDPQLVPLPILDAAAAQLASARTSLEGFRSTADGNHLVNLNAQLDAALQTLGGLPEPLRDVARARATVANYRRAIAQLRRGVEADAEAATSRLAALEGKATDVDSAIDEATTKVAAEVEAKLAPLATRIDELEKTIETQKARLDTAISTYQDQFSKAEARRTETFEQTVAELRSSGETAAQELKAHADATVEELRTKASASAERLDKQAREALTKLADYQSQARRLVSKTGADAVSGGYVRYADQQRRAADVWRLIGLLALLVVAVYGLFSGGLVGTVVFDIHFLAGRLLVALPVLGVALYALAQSGRHRHQETIARQADLDFAALDPYIELLPEAQRSELKAELARRAFFKEPAQTPSGDNTIREVIGLAKEAVKNK